MLVTHEYHVRGLTPTVLHNGHLADPSNEYAVRIKEITSKKKKTPQDHADIADLEWEGSLYLNPEKKPVWPGSCIVGGLVRAGRLSRDGEAVRAAVMSPGDWAIDYGKPRPLAQLKADENFRFRCTVVVQRSRVVRVRPIFRQWQLRFHLTFRVDKFSPKEMDGLVATFGSDIGLSDDRKLMGGRFEVVSRKDVAA